ncbi:hypothetical protein OQZ33_07020 [Pedobacter sp. MC2016-05]|uniref:hypothetical protein n=1 Tax=Pedobacter sp. MC2016-05 TaxID=2994474 RepID=UPI002246BBBD|nr:hypothetical protein [Pedobacter sp. MC2016-05]MCX2474076.1 hypothetical protein [Pedobacter sp. MC2016-05]
MDKKEKSLTERRNENGINYRGTIINDVIHLEKAIEVFITRFFCETRHKQELLHFLILGDSRMNTKSKFEVFIALAKSEYKDWLESYVSIRKNDKKPFNIVHDLNYVVEQRNILAHAYMTNAHIFEPDSTSLQNSIRLNTEGDKVVYFNKFLNKNKEIRITDKDVELIKDLLVELADFVISKNIEILKTNSRKDASQ